MGPSRRRPHTCNSGDAKHRGETVHLRKARTGQPISKGGEGDRWGMGLNVQPPVHRTLVPRPHPPRLVLPRAHALPVFSPKYGVHFAGKRRWQAPERLERS